jgi:hypothetical protein
MIPGVVWWCGFLRDHKTTPTKVVLKWFWVVGWVVAILLLLYFYFFLGGGHTFYIAKSYKIFLLAPMGVSLPGLRTLDPLLSPHQHQQKFFSTRLWEGSKINLTNVLINFLVISW